MSGTYVIYVKRFREPWEVILETPSRKTFQDTIYGLFDCPEMLRVFAKFKEPKGEHILVAFNNKAPKDSFDLAKVYRFLPKKKWICVFINMWYTINVRVLKERDYNGTNNCCYY